jgi:aminoglycoside/choline kinase family phosphotransferase
MAALERAPLEAAEERELLLLSGLRGKVRWELMKGDGSERRFFRLRAGARSAVAIVAPENGQAEAASYLYLAGHLKAAGVPVPRVHGALPEGRCIMVEDLGDTHLEDIVPRLSGPELRSAYRRVLELLSHMQVAGAGGLEAGRLYQGPRFDRAVMLERESKYFFERYVNGRLGLALAWEQFEGEFNTLAEHASAPRADRFLHRDFQSRNIMVLGGEFFFVDFQSGRFGPPAYDVASLLIDPYTGLDWGLREELLRHYCAAAGEEPRAWRRGYIALALQRNLQILGAFSFLGLVRGKRDFLRHIPAAVASLRRLLGDADAPPLPALRLLAGDFG